MKWVGDQTLRRSSWYHPLGALAGRIAMLLGQQGLIPWRFSTLLVTRCAIGIITDGHGMVL